MVVWGSLESPPPCQGGDRGSESRLDRQRGDHREDQRLMRPALLDQAGVALLLHPVPPQEVRACSSEGERYRDKVEAIGSIPVTPT